MLQINGLKKGIEEIIKRVKDSNKEPFIIAIAGTSASGKSYLSENLRKMLEKKSIKTIIINSDNFYKPETPEFLEFYDTFDHQETIDLQELKKLIQEIKVKKEGIFKLPVYSFEKATRIGYKDLIIKDIQVIIVEGIYVIKALHDIAHLNIYVKSHSLIEEIIRRMIRDSEGERLNMEPDKIFRLLVGAYTMFDLFGKEQEELSNIIIINNYSKLDEINSITSGKITNKDELEKELKNSKNSIWISYEDDTGVRMLIKDEINKKIKVYLQSKGKVVVYEMKEKGMFVPLNVLARIIGLKPYKHKET